MKTPTWPLSTLPSRPSHCRCTPTEAAPFLGKPEGSKMITPSGEPSSRPAWRASSRSSGRWSQADEPTKCCRPWRS